jgi:acyl dehydratase
MLYALGLGAGADPLDRRDLRYVYEKDLVALPTMAAVLCTPGFWLSEPDTGVDPKMVLHAEQSIELFRPLAPEGCLVATTVLDEIIDKGRGRGAILYQRRELLDGKTREPVASVRQSTFVRGEGGFGGAVGPLKPVYPMPEREPDLVVELPTRLDQALLYRLSGDYNPLHADPTIATAAGFDRPILHGLCTFGIAARAVLRGAGEDRPERLRRIDARFSSAVLPGNTLRTEIWRGDDEQFGFRTTVVETGKVVLNNGFAVFA